MRTFYLPRTQFLQNKWKNTDTALTQLSLKLNDMIDTNNREKSRQSVLSTCHKQLTPPLFLKEAT